ncbi:hypothetical protein [uncultured Desulfosarcina sp.]|uniref:hypothetical protein n=1 Tax=uncultured Desulfosarcina sp. TaxID=218289 RepID=UPI0029C6659A|nr:hypothetical protein [uncultured Desulfosarcina sp.]
MIEEMKTTFSLSYACLAKQAGLSYRTLMRWKDRFANGMPAVGKRGPKKVRPLNLNELKAKIRDLDHGPKRSHGTGKLHSTFGESISRRELNALVIEARNESKHRRKAETCCVSWLRPNLAWAVDDCQKSDTASGKLHLHNLTDLCSRYKLPPIASGSLPCGEEVAGHLAYLFDRFGPPLFCKRDNGSNLNHTTVNEALENAWVIPINNPPKTPSYNGAIERTQREFKEFLKRWQWKATTLESSFLLSETAAHELNHTQRRCLENHTACGTYFGGDRIRYSRRERRSIFRCIRELAAKIADRAGRPRITNVEWRIAARQWLLKNGLIKIEKAGKVPPHLNRNLCHN